MALSVVITGFRSPWHVEAGGGQMATDDLARLLVDGGHRVRAVYAGQPGDGRPPYPVQWVPDSAHAPITAARVRAGVRRLLIQEPVDIVHSTGFEGGFFPSGPPRVATLHQPDLPPWKPPEWHRPWQRLLYFHRNSRFALERRALGRASLVIFTSAHSRDLAASRGYPVRDGRVVHNGVDVRRFVPASRPPAGRPVVLFVGRFDDQKGVDVLLKAWKVVGQEAELRLFGAGWKEHEYRRLAQDLALPSVTFAGPARRDQVPSLLQQARVLVLPSRYENFPLSLLEAMACAVPVVATAVGGVPELLTDGDAGFLVPSGDANRLAAAMRRLVNDAHLARRLGEAGRALVESRYTWEIVGGRVIALYEEVRAATRAPS